MRTTQSFTQQVKDELCQNQYESSERLKALLSAYIRINGSMIFQKQQSRLSLETENARIAKFIYQSINQLYQAGAHLSFYKNQKKKTTYVITVQEKSEEIVEDLEISFLEGKISKNIVANDASIAGYLAGAFLASGSINSPRTSNYHLELSLNSENYAKWMSHLFARYKNSNIEPKITHRRDKFVIYFKKSDQIANFLIIIGAVEACMEFENIRVDRDFANNANRLTNLDTANMSKIYETAQRQIQEIKVIDARLGLPNIANEKLRFLCEIRLENDAASLLELSLLLSERMNKTVTKSNVNHLFRAIHQLYERVNG
ncbi:MAG TPA: DNA-binding protein WhiA [Bacilli bacterium]|nr:DNA-binding protein WhiA [Bacilli bacterium]HPS18675.1 DNA-binding protein WhiA [Bacilli bacterium]